MNNDHLRVLSPEDVVEFSHRQLFDIKCSPDGQYVLVVFGNLDLPHEQYSVDEMERTIWCVSVQDSHAIQLTNLDEDGHAPVWSKDSQRIAYFSRKGDKTNLWVMNADGSEQLQLTHHTTVGEYPFAQSQLSWSPDSRFIAYTLVPMGGLSELRRPISFVDENEIVVETWRGTHLPGNRSDQLVGEAHIFELDSQTDRLLVSQRGRTFRIFQWTPDGNSLITQAGSEIQLISIDTGETRVLYKGKIDLIHCSFDQISAVRQIGNNVQIGILGDDKFKRNKDIEVEYDELKLCALSPDASVVYATVQKGVTTYLIAIDVSSGTYQILTGPGKAVQIPHHRARPSLSENGKILAFPYETPTHPKVWVGNAGLTKSGAQAEVFLLEDGQNIRQLTHFNRDVEDILLGQVRIVTYKSEGWDIEALLVLPAGYEGGQPLPTLVYLHGGPEQAVVAAFSELISARGQSAAHFFASRGYAVLLPNFRGSAGYGDAFKRQLANYHLMDRPYKDVIAGVEYLIDEGIADPERLAIYGHSFGAQLTAWAIAHTNCFKCALGAVGRYDMLYRARVAGVGFHTLKANRQGDADPMDTWLYPEIYKMLSPIEHIKNVKTPMLLIETKAERGQWGSDGKPYFKGLKALSVPSYLVYYPKAFHTGGWNDQYKLDYLRRALAWFDHWLRRRPLPDWFEKGSIMTQE